MGNRRNCEPAKTKIAHYQKLSFPIFFYLFKIRLRELAEDENDYEGRGRSWVSPAKMPFANRQNVLGSMPVSDSRNPALDCFAAQIGFELVLAELLISRTAN